MMKAPYRYLSITTVPLLVLTGCAGVGSIAGDDTLSVRSTPSAATVYIMEQAVGQTPLELTQQMLYPNTYSQDKAHLYGVITLKKSGCQDYTQRVSSRNIARGLDAQLECNTDGVDIKAASSNPAPVSTQQTDTTTTIPEKPLSSAPATESSAKQRLLRIDQLKEEGLITEQEYQAVRQRILDAL